MTENEAKNLLTHIYNKNSRKISENFNGIEAIDAFDMAIKAWNRRADNGKID